MNPARIVFPGFWFGKSDVAEAEALARRGVGGFCVYNATAAQMRDFSHHLNEVSSQGQLLFCADIRDNLSEVITDAPELPVNNRLLDSQTPDAAYRKGNLLGRMARSSGVNWVLAPVVDLGYIPSALSEDPMNVTRLAEDMIAGISNAGALSCMKYFPGLSGVLKSLAQLEDEEFVPYKHLFRRADAIMPSDMIFPNLDEREQAMLSDKIIRELLRKRLNYKGVVVSFPLSQTRLHSEQAAAVQMLHNGVEVILSAQNANAVIDALEKEMKKGTLFEEVSHAVSNLEMFVSKVTGRPEPDEIESIFELARHTFE